MAHISFDASRLDKFVQSNELAEMQAMVNAETHNYVKALVQATTSVVS